MKIFKSFIQHQKGMAILMVVTSVALMTMVLADMTFETQLNKIKIYNLQDRSQAKLNAEAGLKFALAKLKLYQQAINMLEKDKALKDLIKPSAMESVVTMPFVYPIPMPEDIGLIQKNALEDFTKNMLLTGKLSVSMQSVSGFLNPNNMRVLKKQTQNQAEAGNFNGSEDGQEGGYGEDGNRPKVSPQKYIEDKIVERLRTSMENKRKTDDVFDATYGNLNEELLVKELKFFVSNKGDFDGPELGDIEALYSTNNVTPKHAPLTSKDELYLLQGWPDEIIDMIKDDLTVHEVAVIQVNNINKDQLQILFPNITEIQIEEFFKYRDGDPEKDEEPRPFKTEEDFKNAVTGNLGIVSTQTYDERVKELEQAGLKIGVAGKLFRVESIGEYERAIYKIVAFVDLPIKPLPPKKNKNDPKNPNGQPIDSDGDGIPDIDENDQDPNDPNAKKKEEPPREYLEPRVIELRLN